MMAMSNSNGMAPINTNSTSVALAASGKAGNAYRIAIATPTRDVTLDSGALALTVSRKACALA